MLKNYFKLAIRNIKKNKTVSLINISGLAIGLACCMLILLYIKNELAYDKFNNKADRIYRLVVDWKRGGEKVRSWATSPQLGPALKQEFPEISQAVRINFPWEKVLVKNGDKIFYEDQFYFADPNFFDVFSFKLFRGNSATALIEPNSVIIDREQSRKYFGSDNSLDKTLSIEINGKVSDFKVTGILDDIPGPSHITPHFIIPFQNIGSGLLNGYWNFGYSTYLLLKDKSSASKLESEFPEFIKTKMPKIDSDMPELHLQPLSDIHFHSYLLTEKSKLSPIVTIYLFIILALFIILLASINFINLTTARYQGRAKEVGIRKVVGAIKLQLIKQFLSESLLMVFISLIISIILVEILLPVFNSLSGKELIFDLKTDYTAITGFIFIAVVIGIISGIYPAFILSKYKPAEVLKNKSGQAIGSIGLRKILVTMQFVISIILILGTIIVYSQLEYIKNKSLGFDKENVVEFKLNSNLLQKSAQSLKNEMLSNSDIINASLASAFPYNDDWWKTTAKREGGDKKDEKIVYTYEVDFDYLKTLKANIIAGRDFSAKLSTDSSSFIINEAAVKEFGWNTPDEALGKNISWLGNGLNNPPTGPIIGIVKDFNFKSLHEKISPAVFHITQDPFQVLAVRILPNSTSEVLKYSEDIFKKIDPSHPFEFSFLNDEINADYKPTEKLGDIFTVFSFLAIFIACLGLFGLVFFSTEQRIKEIGIRKVLGASVGQIVYLLTKELMALVLIANIIAWPTAYYIMNKWLQNFAYRTKISMWAFILSAAAAFAIALLTVSAHAIKSATANPVKSLKYE